MSKVYILKAKRSAIGAFLKTLKDVDASTLGAKVLEDILDDKLKKDLDEVIVGNVLSSNQGMNIARQIAIKANLSYEIPAYSVNMVCGSGLKSLSNAIDSIKAGRCHLVAAGGIEMMSQAPFFASSDLRVGKKMGNFELKDSILTDGLTDAFHSYHMGITAENVAKKYKISREEQDEFALNSQKKAIRAVDEGRFNDEITPFEIKGELFLKDEYPNRNTNEEKLSKLRLAFDQNGSVTAGSSSGINDGVSFTLLASEEYIKENSLNPLAEVIGYSQVGLDPAFMGMGPFPAINKVLEEAKLKLNDIDLMEINEAFAAQSLAVLKELSKKYKIAIKKLLSITNVNGGAIALGHPLGASGNRILVTLVHEMIKRKDKLGIASLCIGGGMGVAIIIKRIGG